MISLHKLLERTKQEQFWNQELSVDNYKFIDDRFQRNGKNAMCFFIGAVESLEGMKYFREAVKLPYENCWFEFTADPKLNLRFGCLLHKDGENYSLAIFRKLGIYNWCLHSYSDFVGGFFGEFRSLPIDQIGIELTKFCINILFVFLTILNCSNVERVINAPDKALQAARLRRGKLPLFSFWTLHLKPSAKAKLVQARIPAPACICGVGMYGNIRPAYLLGLKRMRSAIKKKASFIKITTPQNFQSTPRRTPWGHSPTTRRIRAAAAAIAAGTRPRGRGGLVIAVGVLGAAAGIVAVAVDRD